MFFEPGFLGTRAAAYMDVVTLYFALLPFLVGIAVSFAVRGNYAAHYRGQVVTFILTLAIVVVFEVGVRIGGGFLEYAKESDINFDFLVVFLSVHILVAIATVGAWLYLIYSARKTLMEHGFEKEHFAGHKQLGRKVFGGIVLTSLMGVMIYLFLFVM